MKYHTLFVIFEKAEKKLKLSSAENCRVKLKLQKVTKINLGITAKRHAHLQTMTSALAKF